MHRSAIGLAAAVLLLIPLAAASAFAQSGATLTPDGQSFLVNKDIGNERWTIALNLSSDDPSAFNNITGNVFKRDGSPPSFILCQVRLDSTGSLNDPSSTFRLQCSGTNACGSTAKDCARSDWVPISNDIQIPADFFLPPAGLGSPSSAAVASERDPAWAKLGAQLEALRGWLGTVLAEAISGPDAAVAQGNDRGATLTLDGFNYLVNKDLGGLRWSISLNYVPERTDAGTIESRLGSVTGNVFDPAGNPSFIYCTQREDSTGTLNDPNSNFRLSCVGTDACQSDANNCADNAWNAIPGGDDVQVPASFFLPPGGLPAAVQSDPDIFVIGRTSDPPAIVTGDFSVPEGDASLGAPAGGCPVGVTCLARTIGVCSDVAGEVFFDTNFGCGCLVDPVPNGCIGCGAGQCGGSCDFPVGGATARGTCLPVNSESDDCSCFAIGSGEERPVDSCGGTLGVTCSGQLCCADDPTDGCDPSRGDISCIGVCVDGGGCDPTVQNCGSCIPPQIPGGGTPGPNPTPTPSRFCGNGVAEAGEECDGDDIRGRICEDFPGYSGGDFVSCTSNCEFDVSDCSADATPTPSPRPTPTATQAPSRPSIIDIEFPSTIIANGEDNLGTVSYRDPDIDVVFTEFVPISGPFTGFSFEVEQFENPDSFDFFIFCTGEETFSVIVGVFVIDSEGNRSVRQDFGFTCIPQSSF
jgi:hypothetical protein